MAETKSCKEERGRFSGAFHSESAGKPRHCVTDRWPGTLAPPSLTIGRRRDGTVSAAG